MPRGMAANREEEEKAWRIEEGLYVYPHMSVLLVSLPLSVQRI